MERRIHGNKDHSSVAASLCSLAQVYRAQGRLDDSASLEEESLAMKRRIHGNKDHSSVAVSLEEESLAMQRRIHGDRVQSIVADQDTKAGRCDVL